MTRRLGPDAVPGAAADADPADVVLDDRYALQSTLGSGGMAVVHQAHDRVLDREVAVKVLRDVTDDPAGRDRFTAESRTLARLSHPGLVMVLDAGTTDDRPYLVLELVDGPSLADLCRAQALEPARVGALGAQIADALGYVHEAGVVHRDVKPANVLLAEGDRALLTDFGIARLLEDSARRTATGFTMGTAAYVAPEQLTGRSVSPATDVYSLGLTLLEALTGERAYPGSSAEAALARLSVPPSIPESLPTGWRSLLARMTALEPEHRPTVAEVAAELRALSAASVASVGAAGDTMDGTETETAAYPAPTAPVVAAASRTQVLPRAAPDPRASRSPQARRPHLDGRVLVVIALLAVVLLALLALAVTRGDGGSASPGQGPASVPTSVPDPLRSDLQQLDDAVNG